LQVLQAVESWVQAPEQEEKGLAQPALETAKLVKEQDVQLDEQGKVGLIKESPKIGASASKTLRCGTGEKAGVRE
jgi:hypothetical protein